MPVARILRERHSVRSFDDQKPITLPELSLFLERSARVQSEWSGALDLGGGNTTPPVDYTARPYPSGGSCYELELYLAIAKCEGLAPGFYHYSAIAYSLILKDVGVLTQTFYMTATEMGLGGCAIGSININLFAKMTGVAFYVEGPVGQFAIGRAAPLEASG